MDRKLLLGVLAISLFSGCGGGGTSLTASSQPTSSDSAAARATIQSRAVLADSLLVSDLVMTGTPTTRVEPTCLVPTSCFFSIFGHPVEVSLYDFQALPLDYRFAIVGYQRRVTLIEGQYQTTEAGITTSFSSLGGWLDHTFFGAERQNTSDNSFDFTYSWSIGDITGTTPVSGNATWTGVMTGIDLNNIVNTGNRLRGDARLTFDMANMDLDIAFTNIRDVDGVGGRLPMMWYNVPVTNGRFETESAWDSIKGQFYGPNHEEVGGVFERNMIIGAFGGRRQ